MHYVYGISYIIHHIHMLYMGCWDSIKPNPINPHQMRQARSLKTWIKRERVDPLSPTLEVTFGRRQNSCRSLKPSCWQQGQRQKIRYPPEPSTQNTHPNRGEGGQTIYINKRISTEDDTENRSLNAGRQLSTPLPK